MMDTFRYGARLNSFKLGLVDDPSNQSIHVTLRLLSRALSAGLSSMDLNYPDHFDGLSIPELRRFVTDHSTSINGLAMRYYTAPEFKLGAFTNPDASIRALAIEQTKRGLDAAAELGCSLMTLWMGQDGFDYSFQADFSMMWDKTISAIQEVADFNPEIDIAIEYKPNEPRAFSLMPDVATTLLALKDIKRFNTGVTLDFAHVLYADEMPAFSAHLIQRYSRILGVHLNDGYGKWDNGLMVGAVHPIQTLELLVQLLRGGFDGTIYFDTFPDHSGLDPIEESKANIATTERFLAAARRLLSSDKLLNATASQNPLEAQRIMQDVFFQ